MPSLLIATKNAHKTAEIRAMLGPEWHLSDLCSRPEIPAPEESGSTFAQNATLKAIEAAQRFEGWVLADDSGLCVDALGGAPGIFSSRFAGPNASDADNRRKLLEDLRPYPNPSQRSARFQCTLALARKGRVESLFDGLVEGHILDAESGAGGFGYDALFVPEGHTESFGVLPESVKNSISHRFRALAAFVKWTQANASLLA